MAALPAGSGAVAAAAAPSRFRIFADGPLAKSEALMNKAGISASTWFVVDLTTKQRIPATVSADSGGHVCMRGVGFNLVPDEPLAPSSYALVLLIDGVAWPYIGDKNVERWRGQNALVHRFSVAE